MGKHARHVIMYDNFFSLIASYSPFIRDVYI